jgi:hypothetical protein
MSKGLILQISISKTGSGATIAGNTTARTLGHRVLWMEGNQMRVLILVAALLLIVPTGAAAAPCTVGLLNTYLVGGFSCEG